MNMECEFCGETFEVWDRLRDHVRAGHDNAIMLYGDGGNSGDSDE